MSQPKTGKFFRRKSDNRCCVKLFKMPSIDGKPPKKLAYGSTKTEAKKNGQEAIAEAIPKLTSEVAKAAEDAKNPLQPESGETLGNYLEHWMQGRIDFRLQEEAVKPLAGMQGYPAKYA